VTTRAEFEEMARQHYAVILRGHARTEATRRIAAGDASAVYDLHRSTEAPFPPPPGYRPWTGERCLQDTLLVRPHGGYGDQINALYTIPACAGRVGRVLLEVRPALRDLVRMSFRHLTNVEVINPADNRDVPSSECFAYDESLVGLEQLPRPDGAPYFVAPPGAAEFGPGRHVGICWSASARRPATDLRHARALPLEMLAPLHEIPDVTLHSLQVGPAEAELDAFPMINRHALATFADTARVAVALDVVVTVDTSVAHLCGALGVPTLTLLYDQSPRRYWGFGVDAVVWYGSMRLVRATSAGQWASAIGRAAQMIGAGDLPPRLCGQKNPRL
jgi:hypothetical protein